MPRWIEQRAHHLMDKRPGMRKSQAYAIATQQSHATGHTPKKWGTEEGREEAKEKYHHKPGSYEQKADPKEKTSAIMWASFSDELLKLSGITRTSVGAATQAIKSVAPATFTPPKLPAPKVHAPGAAPRRMSTGSNASLASSTGAKPVIKAPVLNPPSHLGAQVGSSQLPAPVSTNSAGSPK